MELLNLNITYKIIYQYGTKKDDVVILTATLLFLLEIVLKNTIIDHNTKSIFLTKNKTLFC